MFVQFRPFSTFSTLFVTVFVQYNSFDSSVTHKRSFLLLHSTGADLGDLLGDRGSGAAEGSGFKYTKFLRMAQTRQAELKQCIDQATAKEKMGETDFSVKPEPGTADEEYTGGRDPEWCPPLGSSVHIHVGKEIGQPVDT